MKWALQERTFLNLPAEVQAHPASQAMGRTWPIFRSALSDEHQRRFDGLRIPRLVELRNAFMHRGRGGARATVRFAGAGGLESGASA